MAAAVVRLDGHVVLMVKRRGSGDGTYWHLPAGAIHSDETQLEAVRRVLREQTGLNGRVLRKRFSMPCQGGLSTTYLLDVDPEAHPVLGTGSQAADFGDAPLTDWTWHTVAEIDDSTEIDQLRRVLAEGDG